MPLVIEVHQLFLYSCQWLNIAYLTTHSKHAMHLSMLFVVFTLALHSCVTELNTKPGSVIIDAHGAIIRGDTTQRQIALVLDMLLEDLKEKDYTFVTMTELLKP